MRFSRLSLHRYGHFADTDLDFPRGEKDFHLIFGSNEAGKSTTLSAANDLLFGFPRSTSYDFRFAAQLLRVGATLEHDGQTLTLRRRKGNKDTLLDEAEAPISESPLTTMLQGFSAAAFRTSHSLDHHRLRDGGRAILAARDDVGEALFAAGSGLVGVQGLLVALEKEADAIWGPVRKGARSYTPAADALATAQAALKLAQLRPTEWKSARDELARLEAAQTALEERRIAQQGDLRRIQRLRRLAAPVQRRAALLAAIQDHAPPAFDAEHARIHDQARQAIAAATPRLEAAAAEAARLREQLAGLAVDAGLMDRQDAIIALVAEAGAAAQGADHRPLRERELRALEEDIARLLGEVGLATADHLPSRIALGELQRLAADRSRTETTLAAIRSTWEQEKRQAARARAALAEAPAITWPPEATAALREGQRAVAVEARLDERQRDLRRATAAVSAAMARLAPWTGDVAALAGLALPSETEIQAAELASRRSTESLAEEARTLQTHRETRARLELERARFAAERRAVSAEQVQAARSDRDALWQALRAHLLGGEALAAPAVTAESFERSMAAADGIADTRFATVEASARLMAFDDQIALASLNIAQSEARLKAAEDMRRSDADAWHARLARSGLPAIPALAARQWCADHAEAIRAGEAAEEAAQALSADEVVVAAARRGLRSVLADASEARDDQSLERLLDAVQRLADAAETAGKRRETLRTQAEAAETAVRNAQATIDDLLAGAEVWQTDWTRATAEAGLPGTGWTTLATRLPLFEQLRGLMDQARQMAGRIEGIAENQRIFAVNARRLAEACGIEADDSSPQELADLLRRQLQKAVADAQVVTGLQAMLRRRLDEQTEATALITVAEAQLAPLMAIAGTTDATALAAAIAQAEMVRAARAEIAGIEQTILAEGDGHPLDQLLAETMGVDPDGLAADTDRLERLLAGLDAEIAAAAQGVGDARRGFQALDHGPDAALAAADAEQARAAMAAEAETYLIKRSQAVMLRWAIERYRERRQNPLLARASEIFVALTLGRYSALQIDVETEPARLVGLSADGASVVTIDGMSDGTADQLYLALRLAALEQSLDAGIALPFLADDLFINFDDRRAHAGFKVLGEIARRTQVLFFTHHDHLRDIAERALHPHTLSVRDL
ncbi:AAA family ATPase [Acidisoma sp.]|uniref:ATP-binding protein n=1 Tax=Acidisoma sp. TaxID=1872115 RepID=UPI003B0050E2